MASSLSVKIFPLSLIIILLLLSLPRAVTAVPEHELVSMLGMLRSRGHSLFANAIVTSDILYQVLAGTSFTFFVPIDSSLFALDMTASASDYIMTLRYHIVPRRISLSNLRRIHSGLALPTLLPHHQIRVGRRRHYQSEIFTADGVEIAVPGLFFDQNIAVHGLDGILSFKSQIGHRRASSPVEADFSGNRSLQSDPPPANLSGKHDFPSPVIRRRHFTPPAESSDHNRSEMLSNEAMYNRTVEPPMPEPARVDEFSPASSPETVGFQLGIPPMYGSSPEISPSPTIAPKTQPPEMSDTDADSPTTPSSSISDIIADLAPTHLGLISSERDEVSLVGFVDDKQQSKENIAFSGELPVTILPVTEDIFPATTVTRPEECWPLDSKTVDCRCTDGEISLDHANLGSVDPRTCPLK